MTEQARALKAEPLDAARFVAPGDRTLPTMLGRQAERYGPKRFLRINGRSWTYGEMPDLAERAAARLAQAGVKAGDRVALLCGNRPEFIETMLGCAWLGAVLVPINIAARGMQLQHVLANSGARLLVAEAEPAVALGQIDLSIMSLQTIWLIDSPAAAIGVAGPMPELGVARAAPASLRPADPFAILYTSGTTGPSKGVCCPHAQFFWWGINTGHLLEISEDDVLFTTLPLFHTNALNTLFQALIMGAEVVFAPRFSASSFWDGAAECGATVTYLLGAMVPILLSRPATPGEREHRLRVALAPGVPAQFHAAFAERTKIGTIDGYGSTETNFVIGTRLAGQKPGYMGPVFEGFTARVVDEEDNEVPDGAPGELILRAEAPFAFSTGYFNEPGKSVEAWRNLWFHTGDRVIRDEDGYFKFVDRLKDAIRRRGENISSFEVEQVLLSHPDVAAAAVFPVRSELAEEEVMAAVVKRPESALAELDLARYCEPRLAYFAIPRFIEFVEALPLTENGKVQKYKLRERGASARTWDRAAARK
jgi:crotonobetaine/carnitine-CoA ligase